MSKIENLVKEYSSKKLTEIIEQQSSAYSEDFIEYAKDELIKRGETLKFNSEREKEIAEMGDDDLRNLVEIEWNDYHLEYLEIARKEYLKRNFKNYTTSENDTEKSNGESNRIKVKKRYPVLGWLTALLWVFAIVFGIIAVFCAQDLLKQGDNMVNSPIEWLTTIISTVACLILLAASGVIKVYVDTEENSRQTAANTNALLELI